MLTRYLTATAAPESPRSELVQTIILDHLTPTQCDELARVPLLDEVTLCSYSSLLNDTLALLEKERALLLSHPPFANDAVQDSMDLVGIGLAHAQSAIRDHNELMRVHAGGPYAFLVGEVERIVGESLGKDAHVAYCVADRIIRVARHK